MGEPMTYHCIIVLGIICFLASIDAQISPCNKKLSPINYRRKVDVQEVYSKGQQKHTTLPQNPANEIAINHRSRRTRRRHRGQHHHRHLRTVHGIINIIGWGILLPIGVITARYFRKLPLKCNEWYYLHIVSQISGFILGTVGWGLGMSIRSTSRDHSMSLHGILGTIIFVLTAIQALGMLRVSPNEEHEFSRRNWVICHQILGYALIALIITNIFRGIQHQILATIWKWSYGVILGAMAFTALALELLRWTVNLGIFN